MISCNFVLILSGISFTFFLNQVFTLNQQSILGGYLPQNGYFRYQVAILGIQNNTWHHFVIGGGVIITETVVLSAAQCFINSSSGTTKELRYSVAAGTIDIQNHRGIRIDVNKITIPYMQNGILLDDFAIVELEYGLGISENNLYTLQLPQYGERFAGRVGIVAGYGFTWVTIEQNSLGYLERVNGSSDEKLRFGLVDILGNEVCRKLLANVNINKRICGLMQSNDPTTKAGICTGDGGSPLVVENIIVGIASKNVIDCDDRIIPCLYIDMVSFSSLVRYYLHGYDLPFVKIIQNPPYTIS